MLTRSTGNDVDPPLDGSAVTEENKHLAEKKSRPPSDAAGAFLDQHKTAKIVMVLDTHCPNETGGFVYRSGPEKYGAYNLEEASDRVMTRSYAGLTCPQIINGCIPARIRKYLSNAPDTPTHNHKAIILNVVCGATVVDVESCDRLYDG